jgi:hypothetical protein
MTDVAKARSGHGQRAALADGENRKGAKLCRPFVECDCWPGIGAGDQHRCPGASADRDVDLRFDTQQRRDNSFVALCPQRGGGTLRIGLRACQEKPHGISSARRNRRRRGL